MGQHGARNRRSPLAFSRRRGGNPESAMKAALLMAGTVGFAFGALIAGLVVYVSIAVAQGLDLSVAQLIVR
jgi:hypothetical protein